LDDIRSLIRVYSDSVRESFNELLAEYPSFAMRPLDLNIPRRGLLPSGRTYSFHGIGCCFEKDGVVTDMDFGPDGCTEGFDAWRLSLFAESLGKANLTVDHIQEALNALASAGEIVKSRSALSSHLFFPARPPNSN
jgi:hypothetical protein